MIGGCCKDKKSCKGSAFQIHPFTERYAKFECQNNNEYTYIFRNSKQIDSLQPTCSFAVPVAFPIDETDMVYIMFGKTAYHYRDTFQTNLLKDTCNKTLTYEVNMVQQDTAFNTFPGVVSMFCSVQNIPADYKVEVKYKYVPL